MTRLVHFEAGESPQTVSESELTKAFLDTERSTLETLERFCTLYDHQVRVVILPEIPTASVTDNTPIWMSVYRKGDQLMLHVTNLAELKTLIQKESGGRVHVGRKGLIYGTSAVECVLSRTDAAYPGDADAVVCDNEGFVQFVVEYKKHTLNCPIGDHLIHRYYPNPDRRKYQRLDALVAHYRKKSSPVPFIMLYYATKYPMIRLQLVNEILPDRAVIGSDSGDIDITGMSDNQVSAKIIDWLGDRR